MEQLDKYRHAEKTIQRQIARLAANLEGTMKIIAPDSRLTDVVDKVEDVMREATDGVPLGEKPVTGT